MVYRVFLVCVVCIFKHLSSYVKSLLTLPDSWITKLYNFPTEKQMTIHITLWTHRQNLYQQRQQDTNIPPVLLSYGVVLKAGQVEIIKSETCVVLFTILYMYHTI